MTTTALQLAARRFLLATHPIRKRVALKEHKDILRRHAAEWKVAVDGYFRLLESAVVVNEQTLAGSDPDNIVDAMADWDAIEAQAKAMLGAAQVASWADAATAVYRRIGKGRNDPIGVKAINWQRQHGAARVVQINEETRSAIKNITARGINMGIPKGPLAKEIKPMIGLYPRLAMAVFNRNMALRAAGVPMAEVDRQTRAYREKLLRYRADMIARTENRFATAEGILSSYKDYAGKWVEWVPDPECCTECSEMAKANPYAIKSASGLMPKHPNCECVWVAAVKDLDDSLVADAPAQPTLPQAPKVPQAQPPMQPFPTDLPVLDPNSMTELERQAVRSWCGGGYTQIRQYLSGVIGEDDISPSRAAWAKELKALFERYRPHWDSTQVTLYRGVRMVRGTTYGDEMLAMVEKLQPGDMVPIDKTLSSFSTKKSVAELFSRDGDGGLIWEIKPGRKPGMELPLEHLSGFGQEEAEVLMDMGRSRQFQIVSKRVESGGRTRIVVKEI